MSISLIGRIDSSNAAAVEETLVAQIRDGEPVVLDADKLEYISSAGLRVLLRIRKAHPEMRLVNVHEEFYDILDMTGFLEMIPVERAYHTISVEGCEVVGRGANGTLYHYNRDTVVKVYNDANALADIMRERENARLALVLGIPTAISYAIVKVGDSYGSVFELLNARSFSKILAQEPEKFDWCVDEFTKMLRRIHETEVPAGKLKDMRETALSWADFLKDYLPEQAAKKLHALIEAVPHDSHMIHGDYHTGNLELQDGEVLLIDMDTLAVGYPIFELGSIYNALIGFSEMDHSVISRFHGFDYETAKRFWSAFLADYLDTTSKAKVEEVERKARIIGYTRLVRRSIRRGGLETEQGRAEIENWKSQLLSLLETTDTLLFSRDDLEIEASAENLAEVQSFVERRLEAADCSPRALMQLGLAIEEVFINIASYAYAPGTGNATIRVEIDRAAKLATITFIDSGVPYNPLKKRDPDITLSASERQIGGLGVFLTKKLTDDVRYDRRDGKNILMLIKHL